MAEQIDENSTIFGYFRGQIATPRPILPVPSVMYDQGASYAAYP